MTSRTKPTPIIFPANSVPPYRRHSGSRKRLHSRENFWERDRFLPGFVFAGMLSLLVQDFWLDLRAITSQCTVCLNDSSSCKFQTICCELQRFQNSVFNR